MPIYEYMCLKCNNAFETLVRGDEKPTCPSCGGKKLERQMSAPSAQVKSSGDGCGCPARQAGACSPPGGGCPGGMCGF